MTSGIYKITNLVNTKVYIGSAINTKRRWLEHSSLLFLQKHFNCRLQAVWNKYGKENFTFEVVEYCEKNCLVSREQYYLELSESVKNGYNILPIAYSSLGRPCSEITKKKLSDARKGKPSPLKGRTKDVPSPLKGKPTGRPSANKGKSSSRKGLPRTNYFPSEETKEKMSNSKKGKPSKRKEFFHSTETKEKMSLSHKKMSEETRKKMSLAKKGKSRVSYVRPKIQEGTDTNNDN